MSPSHPRAPRSIAFHVWSSSWIPSSSLSSMLVFVLDPVMLDPLSVGVLSRLMPQVPHASRARIGRADVGRVDCASPAAFPFYSLPPRLSSNSSSDFQAAGCRHLDLSAHALVEPALGSSSSTPSSPLLAVPAFASTMVALPFAFGGESSQVHICCARAPSVAPVFSLSSSLVRCVPRESGRLLHRCLCLPLATHPRHVPVAHAPVETALGREATVRRGS